jgi:hypothetical protein
MIYTKCTSKRGVHTKKLIEIAKEKDYSNEKFWDIVNSNKVKELNP